MSRGSSVRFTLWPTNFAIWPPLQELSGNRFGFHLFGGALHRLDNVLVAGASAQIAFQAVTDLVRAGVRIALQDLSRGHDHSGRAIAALQAMVLPEALLNRVQFAV